MANPMIKQLKRSYQIRDLGKRGSLARRCVLASTLSLAYIGVSAPVAATGSAAVGALALSDVPLFLQEGVPPNLVISYDDSGSMMWAYLPDSIRNTANNQGLAATKSNYYNKMYYDPNVDYRPGLDASGNSLGEANPAAAFTNIYNHGNEAWYGLNRPVTVNLITGYQPIWNPTTIGSWGQRYSGPTESAYYFNRDDSNPGCDGTDLDNACYTKVVVSSSSGPNRPRPELVAPDGSVPSSRDETINFANWYQYYSYRTLAGKTVLSRAFSPENIGPDIRVGHQTINRRGVRSGDPGASNFTGSSHVAIFDQTQRAYFYQWLQNLAINGGTPLLPATRSVGEHFKSTGTNSPYSVDPGVAGAEQVSCRVNAHIMLSDGYWNSGGQENNITRDQNSFTLPDGTLYSPASPDHHIYQDTQAQVTLADVAFHYWATDLSPLENNVPAYYPNSSGNNVVDYWNPANDPATWQRMVNYNIAFGIAGRVPLTDTVYDQLKAGTPFVNSVGANQTGWTDLGSTIEAKADDMYHAAINSRGQFFSASNPDDLVNSLVSVMDAISDRKSSAASVDLNSSSITAGIGAYQARFFTGNWTGNVQARPISDGSGGNSCSSQPIGTVCEPSWSASEKNTVSSLFPANRDRRRVFTLRQDNSLGNRGVKFRNNKISNAQSLLLRHGQAYAVGYNRLRYIRGRDENEEQNGGDFRNRTESRVGAVVHSAPKYVGNGFDASGTYSALYPDDIELSGPTHKDFICADPVDSDSDGKIDSCSSGISQTRQPMVYVGSNDGLMHAYDARLYNNNGGTEKWSYVPNAVIKNLYKLTLPTFVSGSYVDGFISSADVFYRSEWHTMLVGGLRTGGQAYYALDVTDASNINNESLANGRKLVRWEFGDTNTSPVPTGGIGASGDPDLGYTYGEAQIVKSNYTGGAGNSGRWVAIFGNGYNATEADGSASTTGNAVLFVVDIETGLLLKKIDTGAGSLANPNGIAGIAPVLNDTNLTVDYVYAGDLEGNLWKFDLSSSNLADWGAAYTAAGQPSPLFQASAGGNAQPIQSTPKVSRHYQGGNIVYFGTGRYLEPNDNATRDQQAFYGVWDKDICSQGGADVPCIDIPAYARKTHSYKSVTTSTLQAQAVTVDTSGIRETSNNPVDWSNQMGWYLDFPNSLGERSIGKPVLRGEIVIFTTVQPDDAICEAGGSSWLYALDRVDGGPPPVQVFDHNADGEINNDDYSAGTSSAAMIDAVISDPTFAQGEDGLDYIIYGSSDLSGQGGGVDSAATPDTTVEGRVRWRQLE